MARFVASSLFLALVALAGWGAYTATHRIDADGITVSGAPTIGRACSIHDNGTVPHHPAKIHAPARPPRDRRGAPKHPPQKNLMRPCPPTTSTTPSKTAEGGGQPP